MRLGEGRPRAVPCDAQKIRLLRGERPRTEIAKLARVSIGVVAIAESEGARLSHTIVERVAAALGVCAEEIRSTAPVSAPPRPFERGIALEDYTSLGLGSSLASAVTDPGSGDD